MKISYALTASFEGPLSEIENAKRPADAPTLEAVIKNLEELAFLVETVAHMQGYERSMLPAADRARALVASLASREV
jgi:hypothetical protein